MLIYAYCSYDAAGECKRIAAIHKSLNLSNYPVLILLLDDPEEEILKGILVKQTVRKFSDKDKVRFQKHIDDQIRRQSRKIIQKFNQCVTKREMITAEGRTTYSGRLGALCTRCFAQIYTKPLPFVFDGFENKSKTQAKTALINLTVALLNNSLTNPQVYAALNPKEKNRIASVLSTKVQYSWGVFDDRCQLTLPLNPVLAGIMQEVTEALEDGKRQFIENLLGKYQGSPYGMNDNAIALFLSYFIALHGNKYYYYYGLDRLSDRHWKNEKTGKFQLLDFSRIFIQKNAHADIDAVAELCAKILTNTQISKCAQYKTQLQELVAQEGETDSNRHKVAEAFAYLDVGFRLVKSTREKLEKACNAVDANVKKFDVAAAVRCLELIPEITPCIEDGYRYEYSEGYQADVAVLQNKLKNLMERQLMPAIATLSCKITELSQMKNNYSRIIKILQDHGYPAYAEALEKRLVAVEQELLAKQKYEAILLDLNKDILLADVLTEYQACCDAIAKLEKWNEFLQGEKNIPLQLLRDSTKRIDETIEKMEKQKKIALERRAREQYEQMFWELDRDVSFSIRAESYQECCDQIKKLDKWEISVGGLKDIPSGLRESTIHRIKSAQADLESRKQQLSDEVHALSRVAITANTVKELEGIAKKLKRLLGECQEDDATKDMLRSQSTINQAIREIEALPRDIDALTKYISKVSLKTHSFCWQAVKACAMTEKSRLEKAQKEWIDTYLLPAECSLVKLSQRECETWLKSTKELPEYLSASVRARYEAVLPKVERHLHKSRVNHLLAMYDGLTDEEKRIFRQRLVGR